MAISRPASLNLTAAALALLALGGVCFAAGPAPLFEVQGHRGARWMRPENTLSAFRYAVENGADTLEMDLNVTKDGVLVITHDPALNSKSAWARMGIKSEAPSWCAA